MKNFFSLVSVARAQNIVSAPTNIITKPSDVIQLFCVGLTVLFWVLIIFSVIMILIGGYTYASSGGDPEKVGKATKTLMYAAIGIVVALVAKGFPTLIGSFLGTTLGNIGGAC